MLVGEVIAASASGTRKGELLKCVVDSASIFSTILRSIEFLICQDSTKPRETNNILDTSICLALVEHRIIQWAPAVIRDNVSEQALPRFVGKNRRIGRTGEPQEMPRGRNYVRGKVI